MVINVTWTKKCYIFNYWTDYSTYVIAIYFNGVVNNKNRVYLPLSLSLYVCVCVLVQSAIYNIESNTYVHRFKLPHYISTVICNYQDKCQSSGIS